VFSFTCRLITLTTSGGAKIPSRFTNRIAETFAAMSVPAFVGQVTIPGAAVGPAVTEPDPRAGVAVANSVPV
jgi:hypothetical protein